MADEKQQEAHAAAVREKGIRDRSIPTIQSWPTDEAGKPMTVVVAMASDLVPTVPFGNVTIQATLMRPVPIGEVITDEELAVDVENARRVQKAAQYVVGTERRILQWALDPSSRVIHPTTGEGEQLGEHPAAQPGAATPPAQPPVAGAPPAGANTQVG